VFHEFQKISTVQYCRSSATEPISQGAASFWWSRKKMIRFRLRIFIEVEEKTFLNAALFPIRSRIKNYAAPQPIVFIDTFHNP
jgi:hypothetical protein